MTGARPGAVGVIGAGAWGTALANVAAAADRDVVLWTRDPLQAKELAATRTNPRFLPGIRLHDRVRPVSDPAALGEAGIVLLVTPAQTTRAVTASLAGSLAPSVPMVLCAKGIERDTGHFLSDVVRETRPGSPVAVLSGPSFADDVARGLPTAVTLACADGPLAAAMAAALSGPAFRVYHGDGPARGRDRRRRQERARHRLRGGDRPGPRGERQGGPHRAGLRRARAVRPRLRGRP